MSRPLFTTTYSKQQNLQKIRCILLPKLLHTHFDFTSASQVVVDKKRYRSRAHHEYKLQSLFSKAQSHTLPTLCFCIRCLNVTNGKWETHCQANSHSLKRNYHITDAHTWTLFACWLFSIPISKYANAAMCMSSYKRFSSYRRMHSRKHYKRQHTDS